MTKILDLPSRKILIQDIEGCQRVKNVTQTVDGQQNKKIKEWALNIFGKSIKLSVVWIQGVITQVNDDEDYILVDDETGVAKVTGCNKIPFMSSKLKQDQYAMIIGQLSSAGKCPVLRAIKVQNLSHVVDGQSTWRLEVIDQIMNVE